MTKLFPGEGLLQGWHHWAALEDAGAEEGSGVDGCLQRMQEAPSQERKGLAEENGYLQSRQRGTEGVCLQLAEQEKVTSASQELAAMALPLLLSSASFVYSCAPLCGGSPFSRLVPDAASLPVSPLQSGGVTVKSAPPHPSPQ